MQQIVIRGCASFLAEHVGRQNDDGSKCPGPDRELGSSLLGPTCEGMRIMQEITSGQALPLASLRSGSPVAPVARRPKLSGSARALPWGRRAGRAPPSVCGTSAANPIGARVGVHPLDRCCPDDSAGHPRCKSGRAPKPFSLWLLSAPSRPPHPLAWPLLHGSAVVTLQRVGRPGNSSWGDAAM